MMPRLLGLGGLVVAALGGLLSAAAAAEGPSAEADSGVLTRIGDLRRLSRAEAARSRPVKVRGVVTYFDPKWNALFVQDETGGAYIFPTEQERPRYRIGDRVEVTGRSHGAAYANSIIEERIEVLGTAPLPAPTPVTYGGMISTREDSQFVEIEGVVRGVTSEWQRMEIDLAVAGGRFLAHYPRASGEPLPLHLLHARVRVRGVCGSIVNPNDELVGVRLFVAGAGAFTLLEPAVTNGFELPLQPVGGISAMAGQAGLTRRVRVSGVVTLRWPSGRVYVQDGEGGSGLGIRIVQPRKLLDPEGVTFPNPPPVEFALGERIEAVGYPAGTVAAPELEEAEVRRIGAAGEPPASVVTAREAAAGRYHGRLVRLEASLVDRPPPEAEDAGVQRLLLEADGLPFEAHLESPAALWPGLRPESVLRMTGVCVRASGPPARLHLLLRQPSDIVVLRGPPTWFTREALRILGIASALVMALLGWILFLRRQSQQTAALNQRLEERIRDRTRELVTANEQLQAEVEERRRAESALRESEARIHTIVEHNPEAIVVLDAEAGRFVEANGNALRLFDLPREELLGLGPAELSPAFQPDGRLSSEGARGMIRAALEGQTPVFEWTHRRAGGREIACEVRLARMPAEGRSLVVGTITDITERKQAEQQLLAALSRERELSEMKSSFVSLVSHEFRTPLGVILSSAEILDRYLDRLPVEKRREHLVAIHKSVERMAGLMEEVLLLGKVEAGTVEFKPAPFDLEAFCQRLTGEILAATHHSNPIRASTEGLPAMAFGDEGLLRHIFTNLLENAVKYSPPGSPVDFTASRVDGAAVFRVRDEGCGIPEADQERVFQAFHRGRNVKDFQGTGLGLVIVKKCVTLHGGSIRCESAEGRGTEFTVTLPLFEQSVGTKVAGDGGDPAPASSAGG